MVFKMAIRMVVGGDNGQQQKGDEPFLSNSQSSTSLCEQHQRNSSSSLFYDGINNDSSGCDAGSGTTSSDALEFVVTSTSSTNHHYNTTADGIENRRLMKYRIKLDNAIQSIMDARHTWLNFRRNPRAFLLFFTTSVLLITIINRNINNQTCPSLLEDYHPHSSQNNTVPPIYFFAPGLPKHKVYENWEKTKKWRRDNKISTILQRKPPTNHELIRYSLIPTSFYEYDKEGNVIVIEQWGKADIDGIKERGITHDDLIYSYKYDTEYLWSVVSPKATDKITLIMDLGHVPFSVLTSWDTIKLIKERVSIGCNHYPNRAAHLLIVNVPDFFYNIYKMLAEPVLSESTKSKISMLSEHDVVVKKKLANIIEPNSLLPEYGGLSTIKFGYSTHDINLRKHIQKYLTGRSGITTTSSNSSRWTTSSRRKQSDSSSRSTDNDKQEQESKQKEEDEDVDELAILLKHATITPQDIIDYYH